MNTLLQRERILIVLLSMITLILAGCSGTQSVGTTGKGALAGAAIGSGLGAVVGHQSGRAGEGVAIGGATGALAGGLIGYGMEDDRDRDSYYREPSRYDDYRSDRAYEDSLRRREDELRRKERELERREDQLRDREGYRY